MRISRAIVGSVLTAVALVAPMPHALACEGACAVASTAADPIEELLDQEVCPVLAVLSDEEGEPIGHVVSIEADGDILILEIEIYDCPPYGG